MYKPLHPPLMVKVYEKCRLYGNKK